MTMQYFSLGMMHARYLYCCPSAKWMHFRMVNAPPSLFSRVSMDSGVMIPVILVMGFFGATSILYALFLDYFDDILASTLLEMEDVWYQNWEDSLISAKPMAFTEVDEKDFN
jgi:hypothetical protein